MSTLRTASVTALLATLGTGALAQTPATPAASYAMPSTQADALMPPVEDNRIIGHVLFEQLEGRIGDKTDFRWDGQGWIGTDYDKFWGKI
jgi:copper resistance protein B